ncbi:MAG TPA: GAF domain-containing protein [Acidimicrobiales bacterium]|nr:GAF domain-containing protein [Acidimicrobiales bacterium]
MTDPGDSWRRVDPTLQALLAAAVGATSATEGWVVTEDDGRLTVQAAVGASSPALVARPGVAAGGTAGFVLATGQPLALTLRPDDPRGAEGIPSLLGLRPTTVVAVPCGTDDGVVGVIELIDKAEGAFTFDDLELVTLLAGVAAAALTASGSVSVPSPAELAGDLERLAAADPVHYAAVATTVTALMGRL